MESAVERPPLSPGNRCNRDEPDSDPNELFSNIGRTRRRERDGAWVNIAGYQRNEGGPISPDGPKRNYLLTRGYYWSIRFCQQINFIELSKTFLSKKP